MKTFFASFLFLLATTAWAGSPLESKDTALAFAGGAMQAHVHWRQGPQSPGESSFILEWMGADGNSRIAAPGPFRVSFFMPAMGHGSSPASLAPWQDETGQPVLGAFLISKIFLTMRGEWEVRVSVRYSADKEETQKFLVSL